MDKYSEIAELNQQFFCETAELNQQSYTEGEKETFFPFCVCRGKRLFREWFSTEEIMQQILKRSRLIFRNSAINVFGRLLRRNSVVGLHVLRGGIFTISRR